MTRFRRVLQVALWANLTMFIVEVVGSAHANSLSLFTDSLDFLGDAANYAVSLWVLALAPHWRSLSALLKGGMIGGFGIYVLIAAISSLQRGTSPEPMTMGFISVLALVINVTVALLLYRFHEGDANMRGIWLCSRNDAIGNIAVMFAAVAVWYSQSGWPDVLVAVLMVVLSFSASLSVVKQAVGELKYARSVRSA